MALGSVAITGTITGLTGGSRTISPAVITSTSAVDSVQSVTLPSASNYQVSIPTGASAVIIAPPHTNTKQLTFKGVSGDTGLRISPNHPTLIALDSITASPPTSFYLYAQAPGFAVEISFL